MEKQSGVRADKWVRARMPLLRASLVDEAFALGWIRLPEGKGVKKGDRLAEGISLDISLLESHLSKLSRGNPALSILTVKEEKGSWVAIDKPAGIPSHPLHLLDFSTVTQWAFAQYPGVAAEFHEPQPTICPHRLDTGTSGVLMVCLNKNAYDMWRERFKTKQITKKYRAWCWGRPGFAQTVVDCPLGHLVKNSKKMAMVSSDAVVREPYLPARSEIEVLERDEINGRFLCEVTCQTGATHQVRVHLSSIGHPLVGDELYDPAYEERSLRPKYHQLRGIELRWDGNAHTESITVNPDFEERVTG